MESTMGCNNLLDPCIRKKLLWATVQYAKQLTFSTHNCLHKICDYYQILKVSDTASAAEIKSAYYKIAKQCHPDMNTNDPTASDMFRQVSEAYEVLCDDYRRAQYDGTRSSRSGVINNNEYYNRPSPVKNVHKWEDVDPDENFEQKFGQWTDWTQYRKNHQNKSYENNEKSNYAFVRERTIRISLQQAAKGQVRELKFSHPLNKMHGYKKKKLCASINMIPGIEDKKVITVILDQIMEVFVTIHINKSRNLKRVGANVYSTSMVSAPKCKYGGKVRLKGLYGEIELEIPAGTRSGTNIQLSQQGFKISETCDSYGDHFVLVKIKDFVYTHRSKRAASNRYHQKWH